LVLAPTIRQLWRLAPVEDAFHDATGRRGSYRSRASSRVGGDTDESEPSFDRNGIAFVPKAGTARIDLNVG
jgi:hypothetical protein